MLYAVFAVLAAGLLVFDQWLKHWIILNLPLGESMPLFPGFVELLTVHNYGAAWSSFSGQKWLLLGVTTVLMAGILFVLGRRIVRHPVGIAACMLVLSGGIGNLIDRVKLGYVVDMFHFEFA
jgi:signal peptidase II